DREERQQGRNQVPHYAPSAAVQLCCGDATALAQRSDALGKTRPNPRDRRARNRHLGVCGMRRKVETEVKPVLGGWRVRPRPDRLHKATREFSIGASKEVYTRSKRLDYEDQAQGGQSLPLRQRRAAAQASLERGRKRGAHHPQISLLIL